MGVIQKGFRMGHRASKPKLYVFGRWPVKSIWQKNIGRAAASSSAGVVKEDAVTGACTSGNATHDHGTSASAPASVKTCNAYKTLNQNWVAA